MQALKPWWPLLAAVCPSLPAGPALARPAEVPQRGGPEWGWPKRRPHSGEDRGRWPGSFALGR